MAPPATVRMLPTSALCRQQRRCVTLKDACFADGITSPTSSATLVMSSSSSWSVASFRAPATNAGSFRAPLTNAGSARPAVVRPAKKRCHTVTSSAFAALKAEQSGYSEDSLQGNIVDQCEVAQVKRRTRRSKTLGAEVMKEMSVAVVGPGGGTGVNSSVYSALAKKEGFSVKILGQSRAPYDRYPVTWAKEGGAPAPNLESFALDLLADQSIEKVDCLVVGSRGGQVVLPTLWERREADFPAAVVMNGGCAMTLPTEVYWPDSAVSFLLLGGQDYFKGQLPVGEYLKDAQRRVPKANTTTAILLVHEMTHMPQTQLLASILHLMIRAATSWKRTGDIPSDDFQVLLMSLRRGSWTGSLSFKTEAGDSWQCESFP